MKRLVGTLSCVVLLAAAVASPTEADAQTNVSPPSTGPAPPAPGTPIRFRASVDGQVDPDFTKGTWVERGDDFIVVQENGAISSRQIPLRSLSQFEMLTGKGPRTGKGAIVGSAAGALAGLVAGVVFCEGGDCLDVEDATAADAAQVFSLAGAVGGALVGALVGAFAHGDDWQPVSFDSVRPQQAAGTAWGFSVTLRF